MVQLSIEQERSRKELRGGGNVLRTTKWQIQKEVQGDPGFEDEWEEGTLQETNGEENEEALRVGRISD